MANSNLDIDPTEDLILSSKSQCVGVTTVCLDGDSRQTALLLQLPREILFNILINLPTSSLITCMNVDRVLEEVIGDRHFLDTYTRRVLGLSDTYDRDVRFDNLPQHRSLLMELWFLSYDSHSSTQDGPPTLWRRDSLFFPLDCFHHSLLTWLAQAKMAGATFANNGGCYDNCLYSLLSKCIDSLPKFVQGPLTKLMLAFPELIERTILVTKLSLHKGAPTMLQHAWHEGVPEDVKCRFECQYSLEIICGDAVESLSYLSAVTMCFNLDKWIMWTGSVTQFPGCRFENTRSQVSMNSSCTVSEIRSACVSIKELVCELTWSGLYVNGQWKRQILYPGLCYQINQITRKEHLFSTKWKTNKEVYITYIFSAFGNKSAFPTDWENTCTSASSHASHQNMNGAFLCIQNCLPVSQAKKSVGVERCINLQTDPYHSLETEEATSDPNTYYIHMNLDTQQLSESSKYLQAPIIPCEVDSCYQHFKCQTNCWIPRAIGPLELHVQKEDPLLKLAALFRPEILRYLCDSESHQILCPSCSKLWFPSNESLTKCISQIKSRELVPMEFWPHHILRKATVMLTEMCR